MTLAEDLSKTVHHLACEIGERNVWLPDKLDRAAQFIEATLQSAGYSVRHQNYEAEGKTVSNLEVELLGTQQPDKILVIGAHYDSRCAMDSPKGRTPHPGAAGTPGANDNATGVAGLLALALAFADQPQPRTIRFVAFVNEEPPFFQTPLMGSSKYAQSCLQRGDDILGAVVLDTIGYYSEEPNSQKYPFPFGMIYPSTANFIAFLSNRRSKRFLQKGAGAFRGRTAFPFVSASLPAVIPRIGWSDDWSFWRVGYPAFTVTDTAFLRYRWYHTPEDTPEKLSFEKMAQVIQGLEGALEILSATS
jgi:Zn-dependent M28 family amino/carboxypeptidase